MHVLLIVIGLLLLLFGGGCTLIGLGLIVWEPQNFARDMETIVSIWLPFGLAPLVGGYFLFRQGLKIDRQRRQKAREGE